MGMAVVIALITGIPAIITSLTALVKAIKAKSVAKSAETTALNAHAEIHNHVNAEVFPIQDAGEDVSPK